MARKILGVLLASLTVLLGMESLKATNQQEGATPQWFLARDLSPLDRITRSFKTPAIQAGTLKLAGDFCRTRLQINSETVAILEPYTQTLDMDVTPFLKLGDNRIDIVVEPISGAPAAVALELKIMTSTGEGVSLRSGANWQILSKDGKSSNPQLGGPVRPEFWGIGRRPITNDPFDNYDQWKQAKGGNGQSPKFYVAPGFEITQLRVAQPDEGSWVSLASDEKGRLLIGREDKGFLRVTTRTDGRTVTKVQAIPSDLLECRGLACHAGWVYASANNSKKVVRFKLDESGQVTDLTTLREFPGDVGHGRNDLRVRDNNLLLICGDSVQLPPDNYLDTTSPLRKKVAGKFTREGTLWRSSLEGKNWELLASGLRNPYGVDTQPQTEAPFTYDADNEYDLGMPWYRPTRILQLIPGGEYGYREATAVLPPRFADQPDNAPPLIDIGRGSPTAVVFGNAFQFPAPYQQAFFALDWTYGRVLAVHLAPCGAGYRAANELFLQGKPLNVTDVVAGKDGAMYLITGGRKTQSALYRVSAREPVTATSTQLSDLEKEMAAYSAQRKSVLHSLQATLTGSAPLGWETLLPLLNDPDPLIRYSARTALEKQPASAWTDKAFSLPPTDASLPALLAAARLLDPVHSDKIIGRLTFMPHEGFSLGQKLVWLRVLELAHGANPEAVRKQRAPLEAKILAAWKSAQARIRQVSVEGTNQDLTYRAALMLQILQSNQLPKLADEQLLTSQIQEDQILGLMVLRNQQDGFEPGMRDRQLKALASMPQMVGGEGLPAIHAWLERETLATLAPEQKKRYANLKASLNKPEPLPPTRPLVQKWAMKDLEAVTNLTRDGDPMRGREIFRNALCSRCHRFGDQGKSVGPDLTQVAARFSTRDILDSILDPSKSIAENYRAVSVQTTDGKVVTGRLLPTSDFRSEKIRILPDLLRPDQVVEIDKKAIEEHKDSPLSLMPQGLLDQFTPAEIQDLLAYLIQSERARR